MPVAFTSIITSPAFGPARSTSVIVSGLLFSNATAARVFMAVLLVRWLELWTGPDFPTSRQVAVMGLCPWNRGPPFRKELQVSRSEERRVGKECSYRGCPNE